jgi:ATP-dependent DNA helicase RecG
MKPLRIFISSVQKEFVEERAMLRVAHGSIPGNPLLAEPLYLTKYIERMGTGTRDMIRRCKEVSLPEPEFAIADGFVTILRRLEADGVRPESQPESLDLRVLGLLEKGPLSKAALSTGLGQKKVSGQLNKVIRLLLANGNIEYTIPGKPNSRLQNYRLSKTGITTLASLRKEKLFRRPLL